MDAGVHDLDDKYDAVVKLLEQLSLDKPVLHVLNKMDTCDADTLNALMGRFDGIPLCALNRDTFQPLIQRMEAFLFTEEGASATH